MNTMNTTTDPTNRLVPEVVGETAVGGADGLGTGGAR